MQYLTKSLLGLKLKRKYICRNGTYLNIVFEYLFNNLFEKSSSKLTFGQIKLLKENRKILNHIFYKNITKVKMFKNLIFLDCVL